MIQIDWSTEKKESVIKALDEWIRKSELITGESVIQSDRAYTELPELIADLLDNVVHPSRCQFSEQCEGDSHDNYCVCRQRKFV